MKVKEIVNLKVENLEKMMTEKEYSRMQKLGLQYWEFLDTLQDSARLSGQDDEEEHTTISAYLDYLEGTKGELEE